MKNTSRQTGTMAATERGHIRWAFWLALLLALGCARGFAQRGVSPQGSGFGGQSTVYSPREPSPEFGTMASTDDYDPVMAERRLRAINIERHKSLVADTDRLLKLAKELNDEIAHSNPGALTPAQLRKVAEIEKLARGVREKMTMVVPGAQTSPFPPNQYPPLMAPFTQ